MTKVIVCSLALLGVMAVLKSVIQLVFSDLGFWAGIVFCLSGIVLCLVMAHLIDLHDERLRLPEDRDQ